MTEKEEPTMISTEKRAQRLCKCWSEKPTLKLHMKEVFSDGWMMWACSTCGKVNFELWKGS